MRGIAAKDWERVRHGTPQATMPLSEITLNQILEARERRAALQRSTLQEYGGTLLCYTLNAPGSLKRTPLADFAFLAGERMIARQCWAIRQHIRICQPTGMEAIYALDVPPAALYQAAVAMEGACPVGRLFEMDVIGPDGGKLKQEQARTCLVCGGVAAACARNRTHSFQAVEEAAKILLTNFAAETLASAAHWAMLEAVGKPCALFQQADAGAYANMGPSPMQHSASALTPYFRQAVSIGIKQSAYGPAMASLRQAGLQAEAMERETNNGETRHKGLIYCMGLLLCGMGQSLGGSGENYLLHVRRLASVGIPEILEKAKCAPISHGERVYAERGVLGIRGEAAAGFPTAVHAQEALREARRRMGEQEARLAALLTAMAELTDTNLLLLRGEAGLHFVQNEARRILAMAPSCRAGAFGELEAACLDQGLYPRGSGNMLALALFLDKTEPWMP